jgi:hypothetical protein
MTEENNKSMEEFVLTDELREKALTKPSFKILYVGDGDSRLLPFRGETIVKQFAQFYERQANIEFFTVSSDMLGKLDLNDLRHFNIIWADNVSHFKATKNLSELQEKLFDTIEPNWQDKIKELNKESAEAATNFINELTKKKNEKLKIIYSLDEFIWEGSVGRVRDVQTVQLMESFISMSDTLVVPTPELKEAIQYYKLLPNKDVVVIPSSVNPEFFPLYKDFSRSRRHEASQIKEKPKVLVKGISIPQNVQEFIINNHGKMDITVCSVGEVNDHVMGLMSRKKINHIYHWANPQVNRRNILATYALERDAGFDFVIHTKPDDLSEDMYEITTGDEDVLFSISYGALPICGYDHLGYDEEDTSNLAFASGITFGKDTTAKTLTSIIEKYQTPVLFNEAFLKARQKVENRISTSPFIVGRYFTVMLGKEMSKARAALAKEEQDKLKAAEEAKKVEEVKTETETTSEQPSNIIEGNFGK